MKKSLSILCTALLLTGASSAFASSTDLTVTGLITPAACKPNLSGGGIVDFGKISTQDLNKDVQTRLPDRTVQLTVNCDAEIRFAIQPIDNRAGSSTAGPAFGLGLINGTEKLGRYYLEIVNPVADIPSTVLYSANDGSSWYPLEDSAATTRYLIGFGNRDSGAWDLHPLKDVAVDIFLNTAIAPTKTLTLTDDVLIDGSATLQIIYL